MEIYHHATAYMGKHGNASQWDDGYPSQALIESDIKQGNSYLCVDQEKIYAVFYFAVETEPTYIEIFDGSWLNDDEYAVIHRLAVSEDNKGVASFCLNWCFQQKPNIRIDTHRENIPMRKALEKNGYVYCGVIYIEDGTPRLAYQKFSRPSS